MTQKTTPEVSVCVCTYKRSTLLLHLLDSLAAQTFSLSRFEVIVVDNDEAATANSAVRQAMNSYPDLVVRYAVEPMQGISFARNRTVAMASGELLAFIDDDELAAGNWLNDLVECMKREQVDAVLGPVMPHYPEGTRSWVKQSTFFERPRFASGTLIGSSYCRTGNALIRACWLNARRPASFDARFALVGGEDYDFFKWLESQGGKFVWCDTALVHELVPVSRQSPGFIFERCFRTSIGYWREEYAVHPTWWIMRKVVAGLIGGTGFVLLGALIVPFSLGKAVYVASKGIKGFARAAALTTIRFVGYGK